MNDWLDRLWERWVKPNLLPAVQPCSLDDPPPPPEPDVIIGGDDIEEQRRKERRHGVDL